MPAAVAYAFLCTSCGAPLAVPADPSAVDARCEYCGVRSVLPSEILAERRAAKQAELALVERQVEAERARALEAQAFVTAANEVESVVRTVDSAVRTGVSIVKWIVVGGVVLLVLGMIAVAAIFLLAAR